MKRCPLPIRKPRLAAALLALASPLAQADLIDDLLNPSPLPGMPTPDTWWTSGKPDLGSGTPANAWSRRSNWTAPLEDGRALGFGAQRGSTTSFNDVSGATYRSLSFTGNTAYVLQGEGFAVEQGLYNGSSAMQIIQATVGTSAQSRSQTWNGGTAGLQLSMAGVVNGSLTLNQVQATAVGPLRLNLGTAMNLGTALTLDLRNSQLTTSGSDLGGGPTDARVLMTASQWNNTGRLALGSASREATLQIDGGSKLRTDELRLSSGGTLTLAGGQLSFASLSRTGVLDWQRGLVQARGALGLGALGSDIELGSRRQLEVQGMLTVGSGERLTLAASSNALQVQSLRLQGGMLRADGALNGVPLLSGHGQWLGRVGGSTSILAGGGRLQLGDAQQAGAVALQGVLNVGAGASVQLDALDVAQLGRSTMLAHGAVLASTAGIALGRGETLTVSGAAQIQGRFINDGTATAQTLGLVLPGLLSVGGEVSGTGAFRGRLELLGGLSPGEQQGLGLGSLDFGGGEVWLGEAGLLTLDIGQHGGQWTGDRLANIGVLHAAGALRLRLHGVDPTLAGGWQALSFGRLAGQFGSITLEGAEGWTLDTAQLMANGRVSLSPVPEPTPALLMLLGLAALPWCRRRMQG